MRLDNHSSRRPDGRYTGPGCGIRIGNLIIRGATVASSYGYIALSKKQARLLKSNKFWSTSLNAFICRQKSPSGSQNR